jgi:hypothetical protein
MAGNRNAAPLIAEAPCSRQVRANEVARNLTENAAIVQRDA